MKNIVSKLALAAVLASGLAAPALADVDAVASITKTKNISVNELISITKDIHLVMTIDTNLARAAEAMTMVNTTIRNNTVDRATVPLDGLGDPTFGFPTLNDGEIIRTAVIDGTLGSVNGNRGVTGVNQDVGAMANQGNIWSLGLAQQGAEASLFTDAQTEVDQKVNNNHVTFQDVPTHLNGQVLFTGLITSSINNNRGLTGVNQNVGNMMNQTNAVAVAAGVTLGGPTTVGGATVALAETALGQETTGNTVTETTTGGGSGTDKLASAIGSINGNIGITQVNQAVGNMGNQGNAVAVGAAVLGL